MPPILIASLTRRCNLQCEGCYSRALRPHEAVAEAELSDDRFMEIFSEALGLGVGIILLAGGEPLLRRKLVEGASKFKGILFPLFTNGTLIKGFAPRYRTTRRPSFSHCRATGRRGSIWRLPRRGKRIRPPLARRKNRGLPLRAFLGPRRSSDLARASSQIAPAGRDKGTSRRTNGNEGRMRAVESRRLDREPLRLSAV